MERINISDVSRIEREACYFLMKKYGTEKGTIKARRFLKNCQRDREALNRVEGNLPEAA